MDCTARMAALLGRMRRERNGAVADSMRLYGKPYGLNYGVSLPTVRQIARAEGRNDRLARLLWLQDVRELKLAALHLAEPESLHLSTAAFWTDGICNSELAEEAAFAFFRFAPDFGSLFTAWLVAENHLLVYAALMAAARTAEPDAAWVQPALDAVQQVAGEGAPLIARGVVALLEAIGRQNETDRQTVLRAVSPFETSPDAAQASVWEELQWRLSE